MVKKIATLLAENETLRRGERKRESGRKRKERAKGKE